MEIVRCLKRHVAREVYFIRTPAAGTASPASGTTELLLDT
ncbi:hypothetical protein JOE31_003337 [Arthrobacter sp. PvP023]|nr:hypothetical protein [Arthrobacter sp. PvP023]